MVRAFKGRFDACLTEVKENVLGKLSQEVVQIKLEFLGEIGRLLNLIAVSPNQFPVIHRDVHKAVARRSPYCIYFRVREQRIIVLAVFHSARNLDVWQRRN